MGLSGIREEMFKGVSVNVIGHLGLQAGRYPSQNFIFPDSDWEAE